MFARGELQDIWDNRPYGYFTQEVRQRKGKSRYVVTCFAYRTIKQPVGDVSMEIFASSMEAATKQASSSLRAHLVREKQIGPWDNDITYTFTAKSA
jgi:hypothetical protein